MTCKVQIVARFRPLSTDEISMDHIKRDQTEFNSEIIDFDS
jgi:hypothetical protein